MIELHKVNKEAGEQDYNVELGVKFSNRVTAKSKEEAVEMVKQSMLDEYNLEIDDDEITEVSNV